MGAIELLKSFGYDNDSITTTEMFIAAKAATEIERIKQLLYQEFFDRRNPYKSDLRISAEWKQFKQKHKL